MFKMIFKCNLFLIISGLFLLTVLPSVTVLAEDTFDSSYVYYTLDVVNFRYGPSLDDEVISVLNPGTAVTFVNTVEDGWDTVIYNGLSGYIKREFIGTEADYEEVRTPTVELLSWSEAKNIFTTGVNALVHDVRSGKDYYVRSFSNGNHADVEPVTQEDTQIMYETFNYQWKWDPRPVWVTINGRTMAASINGMPHGGGVNNSNGMNGQVCIHFQGSTTHNGNRSHENDHQAAVKEAWYAAN